MLSKEKKQETITQFGKDPKDTGSIEVQVALLTRRIENLTPHFEEHKKDFHSKQGLLHIIGQRKALLRYLAKNNQERYKSLIKTLGLRK